MPNIRPGWTPKQSVYLRIAAIEFLRVGHTGERGRQWLDMFFDEWLMTQGIPTVPDGLDHAAALAKYKNRVIASICWHAFLGSRTLQVRPEVRIRTLKRRLQRDLFYLWDLPANIELAPVKAHTHASAQSGVELEFRSMKL